MKTAAAAPVTPTTRTPATSTSSGNNNNGGVAKRAKFVSVTFHRDNNNNNNNKNGPLSPLGLVLAWEETKTHGGDDDDGSKAATAAQVMIAKIVPHRLLSDTALRVGDRLLRINGLQCASLGLQGTRQVLKSITGMVTVVVEHPAHHASSLPENDENEEEVWVECQVQKATAQTPIDLSVRQQDPNDDKSPVTISFHKDAGMGLFAQSRLLDQGDVCISINGFPCHAIRASQLQAFMEGTTGFLSIVACKKQTKSSSSSSNNNNNNHQQQPLQKTSQEPGGAEVEPSTTTTTTTTGVDVLDRFQSKMSTAATAATTAAHANDDLSRPNVAASAAAIISRGQTPQPPPPQPTTAAMQQPKWRPFSTIAAATATAAAWGRTEEQQQQPNVVVGAISVEGIHGNEHDNHDDDNDDDATTTTTTRQTDRGASWSGDPSSPSPFFEGGGGELSTPLSAIPVDEEAERKMQERMQRLEEALNQQRMQQQLQQQQHSQTLLAGTATIHDPALAQGPTAATTTTTTILHTTKQPQQEENNTNHATTSNRNTLVKTAAAACCCVVLVMVVVGLVMVLTFVVLRDDDDDNNKGGNGRAVATMAPTPQQQQQQPTRPPSEREWMPLGQDLVGDDVLDYFGDEVAMAGNGQRIGAATEQSDETKLNYVRFWELTKGNNNNDDYVWAQMGGNFVGGSVLAMDETGDRVAVGFRLSNTAIAYDWDTSTRTWNPAGDPLVGFSSFRGLSFSSDGSRLAVGDYLWYNETGRTIVYEWDENNASWDPMGDPIVGAEMGDGLGIAMSLSGDGTRIILGAPENDDFLVDAGHAQVYEWDDQLANWVQLGQSLPGDETFEGSGTDVAISRDGSIVAVSSYRSSSLNGGVKVYTWNGYLWQQMGDELVGDGRLDWFGRRVSLSADGTSVAVGAPFWDGVAEDAGHALVFDWVDNVEDWVQRGRDQLGDNLDDWFGGAVALSSDGNRLLVGATGYECQENMEVNAGCGLIRTFAWA